VGKKSKLNYLKLKIIIQKIHKIHKIQKIERVGNLEPWGAE
jgi:hypothetical protein